MLLIMLWPATLWADTYISAFGFSVNLPDYWLIMSKEELKDNPDLFNFEQNAFKNIDKAVFEQTKKMISSGDVEIYFNEKASDATFADNVNVTKRIGRLPKSASESEKVCKELPAALSKLFGRTINSYECTLRYIGGMNMFYMEFDGVIQGTRSLQYQIAKSPSVLIVFTATCKNERLETMKREFEDIVSSVVLE